MNSENSAVYIMTNLTGTVLYTGVTRNLIKRVWEHKNDLADGFTKKYRCHILAYFEMHGSWEDAVVREKRIKEWRRKWKEDLIKQRNPQKKDLYENITE